MQMCSLRGPTLETDEQIRDNSWQQTGISYKAILAELLLHMKAIYKRKALKTLPCDPTKLETGHFLKTLIVGNNACLGPC